MAYKVSANSVYGLLGATVSPIYCPEIAASTTAEGRRLLEFSGNYARKNYKNKPFTYTDLNGEKQDILIESTDVVYGDTDSIFVLYNIKDKNGDYIYNREAVEVEGDPDDILDIPEPDQEKIVDVINLNVGKMDNPTDFWNKPLEKQVDLVLDMPEIEKFKVKYFDAKPIDKNEEDYKKLIDKAEDEKEEDIPEELEYDNLPDEIKDERPGPTTYERIMSSKVPEILGYSSFPEEEEVLKLFKWYQATNKPISESEKPGQIISNRISDKHPKLDRMITSFIDDFLREYYPEKIKIWSKVMSKTSAMNKKESAAFINYLLNPIGSKHSPGQKNKKPSKKVKKKGYVRFNRKFTEQVLTNKLKPLIREMLNKGK